MLVYNIAGTDPETGKERYAIVHAGQTLATRDQYSVTMYIDEELVERRYLPGYSEEYAKRTAENFVNGVINPAT